MLMWRHGRQAGGYSEMLICTRTVVFLIALHRINSLAADLKSQELEDAKAVDEEALWR
jgi:hypothetical protein